MRTRNASAAAFPLALTLAIAALFAQTPGASPTQTLNVNANLVVVPVTVRDNKDRLIRTLTRDDFTLTVDGKPQAIRYFDRGDDLPLTVGLLVDVSGSQRTVLDAERTASATFLDSMLQPERDRAFVVQFGHTADLLADVTPSIPKLQAALQKIDADEDRQAFATRTHSAMTPRTARARKVAAAARRVATGAARTTTAALAVEDAVAATRAAAERPGAAPSRTTRSTYRQTRC